MSFEAHPAGSPRILRIDLDEVDLGQPGSPQASPGPGADAVSPASLATRITSWSSEDPVALRVGRLGGSSLAVALLHAEAATEGSAGEAFVLSIGPAVRAGLPTAIRCTVAGRAPLTGAYADGQVGSDLGRRLASVCDALLLRGRVDAPGAVLHVNSQGQCEVLSLPELVGASPARIAAVVEQRFGPGACLRVGPSAHAGVRFASLIAGTSPPSLVGRGGLGFAFARTGLVALCISAPPLVAELAQTQRVELDRLLLSSPRLALRAEGGTHELAEARAVRGELLSASEGHEFSVEEASRWNNQVESAKKGRHGCTGCPTPCGYVFETSSGAKQGARFSALDALGMNLGLTDPRQSLSLLARCDEFGIDVKEVGALLVAKASDPEGPPFLGDFDRLQAALEEIGTARGEFGERARLGSAEYLRLVQGTEAQVVPQVARRPEANLAVRLGAAVACRGSEPMRTHPFLIDGSTRSARLTAVFAPFTLPPGSADPASPVGKGRLVWWHENFSAAIDASGFCAFSAASLVADGVTGLDDLARLLAPELCANSAQPAVEWLAAGAATLLLVHELGQRWGSEFRPRVASGETELMEEPGMLPEYLRWRGLDSGASLPADWRERVDVETLLEFARSQPAVTEGLAPDSRPAEDATEAAGDAAGSIHIRAFGSLGARIGRAPIVRALPCPLQELLEDLARDVPAAASSLIQGGELLPAIYRGRQRLAPGDLIRDGDVLDLVLVTAGG